MSRIPVAGPWITQREVDYVADAARNAWYQNAGIYQRRFEDALAAYVGTRFAVTLPSCTSAIHLALLAANVGPGDEVVVPDITWIASAAPVTYVGATTVFADVDPQTWCLSAASFEACITPRTRAVIPVDLYGGLPEWDAVKDVAQRHRIVVIEDSAEALGAEYKGVRAGAFGAAGVFSFHGSKTITTGEGGAIVTSDVALRDRMLVLRDHGRTPGGRPFWNTEVAYKYRMSDVQAALGLAQIERAEELIAHKRQTFAWYRDRLADLAGVRLNAEPPHTRNAYWMVTVILNSSLGIDKEQLIATLKEREIDTRPFFHPLSSLPAYEGSPEAQAARARNRTSYAIAPFGINLPSALNLTEEQVDRVCRVLREVLRPQRSARATHG
jgi:perosamine synthetase